MDKITPPPMPEPTLDDHEYELWGQNVRANFFTADQLTARDAQWLAIVKEAVQALRTGLEMTQELLAMKREALGDDYRLTRTYWEAEREITEAIAAAIKEPQQ